MSRTAAELRFALPHPVETARLLPGAEHWRAPLEQAAVEVRDEAGVDLAVAPASLAADAAAAGARSVVLEGSRGARELRRAGYGTARYLPIPSLLEPAVLIPLDAPRLARYAFSTLSLPSELLKLARNRALPLAGFARIPLPGAVVLGSRSPGLPFVVQAGRKLGLPDELDWILSLGRSYERSSFLLFERRSSRPSWILKFRPGSSDPGPFLADERGLRMIAELGGAVAEHAPRFVGLDSNGLPLSIETAAVGAPLGYVLRAPGRKARKRAVVEAVSRWAIEVATATARPRAAGGALRELAFPDGIVEELGADPAGLMRGLETLPAVLEHHELGPTHVLVDGTSFTVIDWEEARADGLPLVDLAFFLAQVLPNLDGELDKPAVGRREAFARLFRGQSPSAPLLFELLRDACSALEIPLEAVGPLLSLQWLRLGNGARRHLAEVWFTDPALGPGWSPR